MGPGDVEQLRKSGPYPDRDRKQKNISRGLTKKLEVFGNTIVTEFKLLMMKKGCQPG